MKKVYFTILAVLLSLTVLILPVAADSGWQSISVRFDNNLYISETSQGLEFNYFYAGTNTGNHYEYKLTEFPENITAASRLTGAEFSLSQGDVVVIPDINVSFTGWLGGSANRITHYRWAVCYFNESNNAKLPYTCFMATGKRDFKGKLFGDGYTSTDTAIKGDTHWGISSLEGTTLIAPKSYTRCSVLLLLYFDMVTDANFSMNNCDFTISFGNQNSPYAPSYDSFDDTQVQVVNGIEQQVLHDTSEGKQYLSDVFANTDHSLSTLVAGFAAVSQIADVAYTELSFINPVIHVSLALGLAGFILNLGFTVLNRFRSRSDPADRQSKPHRSDHSKGG